MSKPMIRSDLAIRPALRELRKHLYDAIEGLVMAVVYTVAIPVAAVVKLWLPVRSAKRDAWEAALILRRYEDT